MFVGNANITVKDLISKFVHVFKSLKKGLSTLINCNHLMECFLIQAFSFISSFLLWLTFKAATNTAPPIMFPGTARLIKWI